MAFTGVIDAPALSVAPCGLLSVADVVRHTSDPEDEKWIRGFNSESTASPTVHILTINNDPVTNGTIFDGTGVTRNYPVFPFLIEVKATRTGKDLISDNPLDGLLTEQADSASQKAAEYELWEGNAARALSTPGTGYLIQQGKATDVTGGGQAPAVALARLEQAISNSPTGSRGLIHMTRDVASELGDHLILVNPSKDESASTFAVTRLGTLVVIGSGYTGNGPIGATGRAASATNKWMFATSGVEVHLGAIKDITTSVNQGFDPAKNDSTTVVQRPIAVHFDPSIWYAAQVTLN